MVNSPHAIFYINYWNLPMIVHIPSKTIKDRNVFLKSRFEMQKSVPYFPLDLWYRFPKRFADHLSPRADAFAPTALLIAMYTGEDLFIRGAISLRLAYNLFEYRNIYHAWNPNLFQQVDIQYDQLELLSPPNAGTAVVTAFSGGVDSFYTLWSHLPQNQPIPDARITHGLFVHGLDLRLDDEANYQAAAEPYSKMFDEMGLELIQTATNAFLFSEFRINWTMFHGAPLIGAALSLGSFISRFYIASSHSDYNDLVPHGSTPLIDHLLSTEVTYIVNHGTNISRSEKTAILTQWPITHHKLRVCANKVRMHGLDNCCACQKCYRMMTLLELFESRSDYDNFPKKMTPSSYIHWGLLNTLDPLTAREIRNRAFVSGRIGMAFGIQLALVIDISVDWVTNLVKKLLSRERLYKLKRAIYTPESNFSGKQ